MSRENSPSWVLVVLAAIGVVAIFLFFMAVATSPAYSRDPDGRYAGSPHEERFKSQHNQKGEWCCDKSDGHFYDGGYSFNADGSVTVELDGKPHVLPKHMVLTGANPTGHAIWWFLETAGGHVDYCFAPGTLS